MTPIDNVDLDRLAREIAALLGDSPNDLMRGYYIAFRAAEAFQRALDEKEIYG